VLNLATGQVQLSVRMHVLLAAKNKYHGRHTELTLRLVLANRIHLLITLCALQKEVEIQTPIMVSFMSIIRLNAIQIQYNLELRRLASKKLRQQAVSTILRPNKLSL